jgi:D-threo-aldose 1-dehydrogenase
MTPMPDLPELFLGGAGYAGLYEAVDDARAQATLAAAWQAGIRGFDTAPHYGAGLSEERLGRFLADRGPEEYVLSTKVGRLLVDDPDAVDGAEGFFGVPARTRVRDYSAAGVRKSLEESCARMGVDRVDIALIHDPDEYVEQALAEAVPELTRLRAEGVIDGFGVGVNDADVAQRFVRASDPDYVLIAGRYSLLDRRAQPLLDECDLLGVAVLAAGVFNSGLLADPCSRDTFDYRRASPDVVERARMMQTACNEAGVPLRAAALRFPLRHRAVRAVVSGAASADQVHDTMALFDVTIPQALWDRLDELAWQR